MSVTPEMSHPPMSSLKNSAPRFLYFENKSDMSVTPPVSHVEMWPYSASAAARSWNHALTATRMVSSSRACAATKQRASMMFRMMACARKTSSGRFSTLTPARGEGGRRGVGGGGAQ